MEPIHVSRTEAGFHIEGFPDAVKAIRLAGPMARRLADLWLHKLDLDFVADCLSEINQVPDVERVKREALWRSAIVHYAKCFGTSKARFQLSAAKIFQGEPLGLAAHKFFTDLRDKHLVHDENSYALCFPAAVLNRGDKNYKIEKVLCLAGFIQTLNQEHWNNLKLLADKAHAWVVSEFDSVCDRFTKDLERKTYADLLARDGMTVRVPSLDEVSRTRDAP